ncbi:MAG: DEAD/DEAH box helicase family protein, partial [Enterococcus sp.]|nr:DEAD/DEAH box helicase family protein [Enterococcus sp.]
MAEYKIFERLQPHEKPESVEIILRDEQKEAVKSAKNHFGSTPRGSDKYIVAESQKQFLWNAKMRFGKTLCAMQLVKEMDVKKVLIVTHRPVVNVGFHEDFEKIFGKNNPNWKYGSKSDKGNTDKGNFYTLNEYTNQGPNNHFVFFASMQYLRRSTLVGGDDDDQLKKDLLLTDWDLVVIDEAHEGTRTSLGLRVIDILKKQKTKVLHLSGTPFNLFGDFKDSEIYTWDYIQEQQAKKDFAHKYPERYNPYAELPQMKIYTYSLDKLFDQFVEEGASFKFSEFFRTWTGNPKADKAEMPQNAKGRFVHENEVRAFLDMLCDDSKDSNYPFSKEIYQENFNHTLWIVPGVKEAKALQNLLKEHKTFGNKIFEIKNVAGNSREEEENEDALEIVKNAIGAQPREKYTITISCGRLTTGVTVPEWTAVLYLKGSEMTSASTYMQTIFRVQSPWIDKQHGDMKSTCCVFDFAPDRTLK